jgi:hypothetical protein
MKIRPFTTLSQIAFVLLVFTFLQVNAQTIVSRARVGGYAEDIAFVTSGPLKDQLIMLDGYELHSVNLAKKGVLTKVCRLDHPEIDQFPNGLAYVESENLLVINNAPHPNRLYFFDQTCTPKGTRTIQYLNSSYRPGHIEGLAYIPSSSPVFPDHLMMVARDDLLHTTARVIVMRRDGVQVAEIFRADWPTQLLTDGGIGDVAFLAPNRLAVSAYNPDGLWTMDFSGNILSGPISTDTSGLGEGVIQLSDGRLVASNYPQSLLFFDKNLVRQSQNDRNDIIGLNLNIPTGLAWDNEANRLLVVHDTNFTFPSAGISGVSTTLDSATPLIDLAAFPSMRGAVYLPQEDIIATLRFAPGNERAILLFNLNGTLNSQISLAPADLGQNFGPPGALAYLPGSDEFVVAFNGMPATAGSERQRLRVFSRAGALVRTIELGATGTGGNINAVEYFEDPQGAGSRLLILNAVGRAFITDLTGNSRNPDGFLLGEFNSRVKLGLVIRGDVAAISSGPLAGAFAVLEPNGGEVVIFRLDQN